MKKATSLLTCFFLHALFFLHAQQLDTSFADQGIFYTKQGQNTGSCYKSILYPDGKLLLGGISRRDQKNLFEVTTSSTDSWVTRIHPDGQVDSSFGDNGHLYFDLKGIHLFSNEIDDMVRDSQDRVTIVIDSFSHPILVRILPDGQIDTTFGQQGLASFFHQLLIQLS